MAIILQSAEFEKGLESNTALLESALQWIMNPATFVPPVTVAFIRTVLEVGQPILPDGRARTYTDAGFRQYIQRLYDVLLDTTSLDAGNISILNEFREFLQPPPRLGCCVESGDAPAIGNTSIKANVRVGDVVTFKHEIQVRYPATITCDIAKVEITAITPTDGGPETTQGLPIDCLPFGCEIGTNTNVFSFLYATWATSPSGKAYDFTLQPKDLDDNNIGTAYVVNIAIP